MNTEEVSLRNKILLFTRSIVAYVTYYPCLNEGADLNCFDCKGPNLKISTNILSEQKIKIFCVLYYYYSVTVTTRGNMFFMGSNDVRSSLAELACRGRALARLWPLQCIKAKCMYIFQDTQFGGRGCGSREQKKRENCKAPIDFEFLCKSVNRLGLRESDKAGSRAFNLTA